MAARERFRKAQEAKKQRQTEQKSQGAKKLKNNDSALLLQELSKKKKRGEDFDDTDHLEQVRQSKAESRSNNAEEGDEDASCSILPRWIKFPTANDDFYP